MVLAKKDYENIILKNDKFTEDTEIALGLVKKYVIANKLIIVGGMAIDLALRLKGDKLYEDGVLPDYDFYSPNYHVDAYKIAETLNGSGLKNISVINANHTSTMRVRVNYTVVADVTYMPQVIFEKLPTLLYRDVRIIHPHYQLIDQHRALSFPYENPPWEVITHRWKKDATRYDILYGYYPLIMHSIDETQIIKQKKEIKISSILFRDQCISGFAGLLYWHNLATAYGFKEKTSLGKITVDSGGIVVSIPEDSHGVSIYSNDISKLHSLLKNDQPIKKERAYNRFLDKLPYKIILDNKWEIFDNKGHMMSAHKLDNNLYIANLQNIMLYMLTNLIMLQKIKDVDRGNSFYTGYLLAQSIVKWAGCEYMKTNESKKVLSNKFMPFLPSIHVYGDSEISDSYLNSKRLFLEKLRERPKEHLQPMIIFPESFIKGKIPKKYYNFDPRKSQILQFDGSETNKYFDRINFVDKI
jgi:hypothetical protein